MNKIKCIECGISIPDVPEDSSYDELLCNGCYSKLYMTVTEFTDKYLIRLNKFQRYWLTNGYDDPDKYPCNLDEGDWLEQFACFNRELEDNEV